MVRRFFHSPNTPSFYFLKKKKPPPRISVIICSSSLILSPPHPPTFRYYSFLFWGGGSSSWTPATLQTRAPKHTQESPIATACFGTRDTSQTIGSRRSLIKFERSIQSSPTQKKKDMGCAFICPAASAGQNPLKLIHTSRHEDANHKNGNRLSQGREQSSRAEPKNKIRLISCHICIS